jgi:UDP-N-acetylglucosamine 4-epimerase
VQANILAATTPNEAALGNAYNVALGTRTSLNELYAAIRGKFTEPAIQALEPIYDPPRPGDIEHSTADISKIQNDLSYEPNVSVDEGLTETVKWYALRAAK